MSDSRSYSSNRPDLNARPGPSTWSASSARRPVATRRNATGERPIGANSRPARSQGTEDVASGDFAPEADYMPRPFRSAVRQTVSNRRRNDEEEPMTQIPGLLRRGIYTSQLQGHGVTDAQATAVLLERSMREERERRAEIEAEELQTQEAIRRSREEARDAF